MYVLLAGHAIELKEASIPTSGKRAMAKESMAGSICRCGVPIYYQEQHWEHCKEKDSWDIKKSKGKEEKGGRKAKRSMQGRKPRGAESSGSS
jgi:hypothetical protein